MSTNEQDDNKIKEVVGDYLPQKTVSNDSFLQIVQSTFLDRLRFRADTRTLHAMRDYVSGLASVKRASADLNRATEEELSTIRLLQDAPLLHDLESKARIATKRTEAIRAQQELESMEHEQFVARLHREIERAYVEAQHKKLMESPEDIEDELSEGEKELRDRIEARMVWENIKKKHNPTPYQAEIFVEFIEFLESRYNEK